MKRRLLALDPSIFAEDFATRPFRIGHRLARHPFLELGSLVDLLATHPADRLEYHAGDVPVGAGYEGVPGNGLSAEETIRRIEQNRSWMVLKNVERDARLGWLLGNALDEVAELSERIEPGMHAREGFVFVSSPGSVTPYHIDPEHNFLLQVRGTKTIHLFDGRDRSILSDEELERFYTGGGRNLKFRDALQSKARTFVLEPGDGLYFPVTHPHWVQNGPEPSISFSITFRTDAADARESGAPVIGVNARNLRTLEVDLAVSERLGAKIPRGVIGVAESGIKTKGDVERLSKAGFRAFLVGEALVASDDPAKRLREWSK